VPTQREGASRINPPRHVRKHGGLLLAHYAIRALICDAADEAGYDPADAIPEAKAEILRHRLPNDATAPVNA
jgi:hypothetical protein